MKTKNHKQQREEVPEPDWTDGQPRCTLECRHRTTFQRPSQRDFNRDKCKITGYTIPDFYCPTALNMVFKAFRDLVNSRNAKDLESIVKTARTILCPYEGHNKKGK